MGGIDKIHQDLVDYSMPQKWGRNTIKKYFSAFRFSFKEFTINLTKHWAIFCMDFLLLKNYGILSFKGSGSKTLGSLATLWIHWTCRKPFSSLHFVAVGTKATQLVSALCVAEYVMQMARKYVMNLDFIVQTVMLLCILHHSYMPTIQSLTFKAEPVKISMILANNCKFFNNCKGHYGL